MEPAVIYYLPSNAFSTYGSICFLYGLFEGPCYSLGYLSAKFPASRTCGAVLGEGDMRRQSGGNSAFAPKHELSDVVFSLPFAAACDAGRSA